VTNKLTLAVKFPRSRGEFEGYLWTDGKGAIAGTFRLNDRPFGFFAVREGSRFAAEGAEISAVTEPPQALVVSVSKTSLSFEGKLLTLDALTEAIKAKGESLVVRIDASGDVPVQQVRAVIVALEAAGVKEVHLQATK
jgi:hypothetical protein